MARIVWVVPAGIPHRNTPCSAEAHVAGEDDVFGTVGVQPAWVDWSCHPFLCLLCLLWLPLVLPATLDGQYYA